MSAPEPPDPTGPLMIAPFRELIHNIHQFGQSGQHWSWRCGVSYSTVDPGWVDGACRYDHVCGRWDELVQQGTAHLEKWHGIVPAGAVPDTGQARELRVIHPRERDDMAAALHVAECDCGDRTRHERETGADYSQLATAAIKHARIASGDTVQTPAGRCPECGRPAEIYTGGAECSSPDECGWSGEPSELEGTAGQAPDVAAAVLAAAAEWKARYDEMFDEPPARGTTMRPIYDALLGTDTTPEGKR